MSTYLETYTAPVFKASNFLTIHLTSLSYSLVSGWLLAGDARFWELGHFQICQTSHGISMCSPKTIDFRRYTTLNSLVLV